ncbi:hypothetical protein [Winogradskyella helgolandensis]|jgi:hypothetical protein|uniref:hypothetical protein n=1 Tax=Winogradskyella helgolandensis TaxID=2697010 RepID=UPI0015C6DE4E|nr:hypothetical protein [Winogradskyella helgolandensis]
MKKSLLIFVTGLMLINCRNSQKKENTSIEVKKTLDVPCPVTWQEYKPTSEELEFEVSNGIVTKKPNDSIIQQIRFGRVWFEMINSIELKNNGGKCYLKNYRTDGSLESEGYCTYFEHPVVDFTMEGSWKFYDCSGGLKEKVEFLNGNRVKN